VPKEPDAPRRDRPSGRAAVMDAVLDAATELIAERGPRAVTVRAIAERAGVNHALVHRYFGTKDDLIGAVIAREVATFRALATADGDPSAVFRGLLRGLSQRAVYVRFLARAILDGYRAGDLRPDLSLFGAVIESVGAQTPAGMDQVQVRVAVAALGSMALGWRIFGAFLADGLGLDTMPPEQLDGAIDGFIMALMQAGPADHHPGSGGS
jgi:TetR/AcrR family transcriptional regulator, repressor for neighboring sulfatase